MCEDTPEDDLVLALVNTLSFLVTTPHLDPQSSDAGFLLKDITLLGAALWSAAEAFAAARSRGLPRLDGSLAGSDLAAAMTRQTG